MSDERTRREIAQLSNLSKVLAADAKLPLRFTFERQSLDARRSKLTISGIQSLIARPAATRSCTASAFVVALEVPPTYPWAAIPQIRFQTPVPFHPHIWADGRICWGSGDKPQPDLGLMDWFAGVVEFLQYNQSSLIGINSRSPANSDAMHWWQQNQSRLSHYVPPIDLARLRFWINQSRA